MSVQGHGRPGDSARVLIVEDSEHNAAMLEIALLGIPGLRILLARSAMEALAILETTRSGVQVIVTDLNMPLIDGFELIRRLRADPRFAAITIIVVSADTDPDTPRRVAELGVSAFFPKPYSPAEVRRKLEQLLNVTTP
jgi:CheY-like chemotaxis protein